MADEQADCQSYLLRLWRANSGRKRVWRLSLERVWHGDIYFIRRHHHCNQRIRHVLARYVQGSVH